MWNVKSNGNVEMIRKKNRIKKGILELEMLRSTDGDETVTQQMN